MSARVKKILVDICMTIFLILSFIRWDSSNFAFHFIVGSACTLFFSAHILIHRKWLIAVTRAILAGKPNKKLLLKYAVNIILLIIWCISIITGFLAIAYFLGDAENMRVFSRIHAVATRIGLAFILIHFIQHLPQIISYFKIIKNLNNK